MPDMELDRGALEAFTLDLARAPSPSAAERDVAADAPAARTALDALGAEPGHRVFCTSGSGTAVLGSATIGYGPADETLAHRVNEHIELDELPAGARGYATPAAALTA